MFDFVAAVLSGFWQAKPLEQAGFLLSLTGLGSVLGFFFGLLGWRSARKRIEGLHADLVAVRKERDLAQKELLAEQRETEKWDPEKWLAQAAREERSGNEEVALGILSRGFDLVRKGMAKTAALLAGHHLSLIVGASPEADLAESERLARIAALLDPENGEVASLLEEVLLIHDDVSLIEPLPASFLPREQREAASVITALQEFIYQESQKGRLRTALRLSRRANLVAVRAGLKELPIGRAVTYGYAQQLQMSGLHKLALATVAPLREIQKRAKLEREPDGLATRYLEVDILYSLGRYDEALALLLPLMEQAPVDLDYYGSHVPLKLILQLLHARILLHAGNPAEALQIGLLLLPARERLEGRESLGALTTRRYIAQIHAALGNTEAAVRELRAVMPSLERLLGIDHAEMRVLQALELEFQAPQEGASLLPKVEDHIPKLQAAFGARSPRVLRLKMLRAELLLALENRKEALNQLNEIIEAANETVAPTHHLLVAAQEMLRTVNGPERDELRPAGNVGGDAMPELGATD
jgi:tetratricopeptide (TPR) repeat protein